MADGKRCDHLASVAADPDRQASPVNYSDLVGSEIIRACRAALDQEPLNGRYWLQLGRGYLKQNRGNEMLDAIERSRALGYSAAIFALAVVYHTGNGISKPNGRDAERLYKEAYERGIGYAALGLARLYDEPESPFYDIDRAILWQKRFNEFQMEN